MKLDENETPDEGKNTYKEHLQYNEKEQNVKNIVFDSAKFSTHANFFGITPPTLLTSYFDPCDPRQNFIELRYPLQRLNRATYETTIPTPPTLFNRLK